MVETAVLAETAIPSARAGRDGAAAQLFTPVNVGRMSSVIVEQIRALIHSGQLATGSRLPSERELCRQFGVSRVTVREALRVLDASGLLEIKVGAHGGAFVTAPSGERVAMAIADTLAVSALSAAEVMTAREVLELGFVPLICERATAKDIADLSTLCALAEQALEGGQYTMTMSSTFHVRLAEATQNRAIAMLVRSFREPMLVSLEHTYAVAPDAAARGVEEHRAIVEAVRERDADAAQKIMARHLGRAAEHTAAIPA